MKKNSFLFPVRWFSYLTFLAALFIATGCSVDLAAVRAFAKTSAATADYKQAVDDYVNSPTRQKEISAVKEHARLEAEARTRAAQRKEVEEVQKVLTEYMSALGDIAAEDFPSADEELTALATALSDNKFIGSEAASSASAIAKFLLGIVSDGKRRHTLIATVIPMDEHVQKVVKALKNTFVAGTKSSLRTERISTDAFFIDVRTEMNGPNQQRLLEALKTDRIRSIEAREKNLQAYETALTKIGEGHAYLKTHLNEPDAAAVRKQLTQYAKELQDIYKGFAEKKS